jgi:hypothetical protein
VRNQEFEPISPEQYRICLHCQMRDDDRSHRKARCSCHLRDIPAAAKEFHAAVVELVRLTSTTIKDLPARRDWLDPDLEKRLRAALSAR